MEEERLSKKKKMEEEEQDIENIYMLLKPFTKKQLRDLSKYAIKEHPDVAGKLCRKVGLCRTTMPPPLDPDIYQKDIRDRKKWKFIDCSKEPLEELVENFRAWKLEEFVRMCVNKVPEFAEYVRNQADQNLAHRTILVRSHGFGWDATVESLTCEFVKYGEIERCDCDYVTDNKHSSKINCCAFILFKHWSGACNALQQQPVVKKIGNRTTVCELAASSSGLRVCRRCLGEDNNLQQIIQDPSHKQLLTWLQSAHLGNQARPVPVQVWTRFFGWQSWERSLHGSLDHFLQMDRVRVGKVEEKPDPIMNAVVSYNPLVDPTLSKQFECKSSSQLLENPPLMSMHHNNSTHTSLLLNHKNLLCLLSGEKFETRTPLDFPPPLFPKSTTFSIMGGSSVNGILGLWFFENRAVLWNPFTKEIKIVPPSLVEFESPYRKPVIEYHGFGYDSLIDDYKVIRYVDFCEPNYCAYYMENVSLEPLWEIYSLKSDSWKKLVCKMPPKYLARNFATMCGLCTGKVCHWLGESNESLVSFDLSKEIFSKTATPPYVSDDEADVLLAEINGHVALISSYEAEAKTTIEVSILEEFGAEGSWTKLFIIGPLPCVVHRLMGVGKGGDIFFYDEDDGVAWFDFSTCLIVHLGRKQDCQIVTYEENLGSLISYGFEKYDDEDIVNEGQV